MLSSLPPLSLALCHSHSHRMNVHVHCGITNKIRKYKNFPLYVPVMLAQCVEMNVRLWKIVGEEENENAKERRLKLSWSFF